MSARVPAKKAMVVSFFFPSIKTEGKTSFPHSDYSLSVSNKDPMSFILDFMASTNASISFLA